MNSTFKWVLFDLGDTLVNWREATQYQIENKVLWKVFKKHGMNVPRQEFYIKMAEVRHNHPQNRTIKHNAILEQMLAKEFGFDISEELAQQIRNEQYALKKTRGRLAPKARQTLQWLKKHNIKIGLISNAHTQGAMHTLKHLGLEEYFDEVIISDTANGLKSELIPFKKFLDNHPEIKPEECLMVGDTVKEDAAAQMVGIPAAIFEMSLMHKQKKELEELKQKNLLPKYRINSLEDIREIILQEHQNEIQKKYF